MSTDIELGSGTSIVNESNTRETNTTDTFDTSDTSICVICLEEYGDDAKTMNYNCGHTMHVDCTYEWVCSQFKKNVDITCPVCRFVQCHVNSQYYRRLKRDLGIVSILSIDSPSLVETHNATQNTARYQRNQQIRYVANQRGMHVMTYRIGGLVMCLFMVVLIVYVALTFPSSRDH